jgi:hypothetical protein
MRENQGGNRTGEGNSDIVEEAVESSKAAREEFENPSLPI